MNFKLFVEMEDGAPRLVLIDGISKVAKSLVFDKSEINEDGSIDIRVLQQALYFLERKIYGDLLIIDLIRSEPKDFLGGEIREGKFYPKSSGETVQGAV